MVTPLYRLRDKNKSRAKDFARACGLDPSNYSKIEHGLIIPRPATARRISIALEGKITEHQLLYPQDYATPEVR